MAGDKMVPSTARSTYLCVIAITAAVLLGSSAAVLASTEEVENDREVSYAESPDSFEMVSESSGFRINDQFSISFDEGTIVATYTADPAASAIWDWQLELSFESIIGFKDNGSGVFDAGDTVAWTSDVEEWTFSVSSEVTPLPSGGNLTTVTATSENSVLTLQFIFATGPALAGDVPISATDVKLSITMDLGHAEGTFDKVALVISAEADVESTIEIEELDDQDELNLTHEALGGFFSWSGNASVDGHTAAVGSTWISGDLTLIYPAGDSIVHDPVIGVRSVAPLTGLASSGEILGNPVLFVAGLAFASALVLGTVMAGRRKKG